MARHHEAEATQFEQRRVTHTRHSAEEGKRRRLIRWITKAMGVADEPSAADHSQSLPPPSTGSQPHQPQYQHEHMSLSLSRTHSGHGSTTSSARPQYAPPLYAPEPRRGSFESDISGSGYSVGGGAGAATELDADVPVYFVGSQGSHSSHLSQPHHLPPYAAGSGSFSKSSAAIANGHGNYTGSSFRSVATTSGSSMTSSSISPSDLASASIYEYHHQMPRRRRHAPPSLQTDSFLSPPPHVLIIGAGIGGLALAQGLKKSGIAFTVFERDPTPNYRTQGYRLRINSAGYEALRATLPRDHFEVFRRATGHLRPGAMYVDAATGGAAVGAAGLRASTAHPSQSQHVFSTDRAMLRSLLLTDLVEGTEIQFDMAFKRYQILPSGRVQVQFENGACVEGTVLVGADGTTSRVRRQYIPHHITLLDTDSGAIYGKTPLTPDIEQYFATGSTTMVTGHEPDMALVIEPRGATTFGDDDGDPQRPELDDYLCWVLFARAGQFHVRDHMTVHDLYAMAPEQVAELSMEITSHWCPRVRALLETQDPEWASFLRISSMSPDIKPWQPSVVTLLGDAVHTMTPAGIGCNTALHDARTLVRQFCEHGVNVHAVDKYEQAAREHGRDGIAFSLEASARMFGMPHVMDMRAVVY